jgi:hypothetical protein
MQIHNQKAKKVRLYQVLKGEEENQKQKKMKPFLAKEGSA